MGKFTFNQINININLLNNKKNNFLSANSNYSVKSIELSTKNFESMSKHLKDYWTNATKLIDLYTEKSFENKADINIIDIDKQKNEHGTEFKHLLKNEKEMVEMILLDSIEENRSLSFKSIIFSISLLLINILVAFPFLYFSNEIIVKPIISSSSLLKKQGDNLVVLSSNLNNLSHSLSNISVQQVTATNESISSMEEMRSSIDNTNNLIEESKKNVQVVKIKLEEGSSTIKELENSMSQINESNKRLREIQAIIKNITHKTDIINDIVFNSKILSFNASIEAARAGSHGRGFSVVAEEIASLAKMSGKVAFLVQELLEDGQDRVNKILTTTTDSIGTGNEVVAQILSIFQNIQESIISINDKMEHVFISAKDQSEGVKYNDIALQKINSFSIENNKMAQSTLNTSKILQDLNNEINGVINTLKNTIYGS
ncbi:MAG: hypothetical protein HQK49_01815 [Oligoflexia bacterium]|nr:hypothetical protein [Oligoflexia bacterium]